MNELHLTELSLTELAKVQATLEKRFRVGKKGNIVQIGYGYAEKSGLLDDDRPHAICFYVTRKTRSTPRKASARIEPEITVRLRRDGQFHQVVAPTDVILIKRSQFRLSGVSIQYGNRGLATTGAIVVWRHPNRPNLAWGLLSVGHVFPQDSELPDQRARVRVDGHVEGRFVALGSTEDLDLSLSVVRRRDLVDSGIIPAGFRPRAIAARSIDQLMSDAGASGETRPRDRSQSFFVKRFLIRAPLFRNLLGFDPIHVLHVQSRPGVFRKGTSGSGWRVSQRAACIQFGSLAPQFDEGFGQVLEDGLDWARNAIARIEQLDGGEVRLRLVQLF